MIPDEVRQLLSRRELEVLQYLVQGLTDNEIADNLGLSQDTVKNYVFRIFDKLGVSSRLELLELLLKGGKGGPFGPGGPGGSGGAGGPDGAVAAGIAGERPKDPRSDKVDPPVWKTKQTVS